VNGTTLFCPICDTYLCSTPNRASSTRQTLEFEEKSLLVTANQLVSREWSVGTRYRLSQADLTGRFVDIRPNTPGVNQFNQDESAVLHQLKLFLAYNHRCGFFSQFVSLWNSQSNRGYTPDRPGDDFWQHDFYVGYRFPRRAAEIRLGILNLTDRDYQLNPLNLYAELPRERTFMVSFKFNF
jgi:outer membrane receptor protein involved in Fe transport